MSFPKEFYEGIRKEYLDKAKTESEGSEDVDRSIVPARARIGLALNQLESVKNIELLKDLTLMLNLSDNRIHDLSPLQGFIHLTQLHLARNELENINSLKNLPSLEFLDLRGNKIKDVTSLYAIKDFPNLRCLLLIGNPICASLSYPDEIKKLARSDLQIDPIAPHSISLRYSDECDQLFSADHIQKMKLQIKSLNAVVEEQEKILSVQGKDTVKANKIHLFNQLLLRDKSSPISSSMSVKEVQNAYDEMTPQFPYLQLLTHWRNEAYKSHVHQLLSQTQLHNLTEEFKQHREEFVRRKSNLEANNLSLDRKQAVLTSELQLLQQERQRLLSQLSHQTSHSQEINKKCGEYRDMVASLVRYLESFQQEQSSNELTLKAMLIEKTDQLKHYETRLEKMKEHVNLTADVLQFKELQLRNSQAIFDIERRLFQQQQQQAAAAVERREEGREAEGKEGRDDVTPSAAVASPLLSTVKITAECESFLKAIFRQLDDDVNGLVTVERLLRVFLHLDDVSQVLDIPSSDLADWLLTENALTPAGKVLRKALATSEGGGSGGGGSDGSVLVLFLRNLISLYRDNRDDDVSWGEVLLQFVPVPSSTGDHQTSSYSSTSISSPLTRREIRALSQNHIVESVFFSVLPYHLPTHHSTSNRSNEHSPFTDKGSEEFQQQCARYLEVIGDGNPSLALSEQQGTKDEVVRRLRFEKRILNTQLQQLTRQLSKTAEMVRVFFEKRLIISERKEKKAEEEKFLLEEKVREMQHRLETVSQRNQELSQLNEDQRTSYKLKIQELEYELQQRRKEGDEEKGNVRREYEALTSQYSDLKAQLSRKDTQYTLLQRNFDRLKIDVEKNEKERSHQERRWKQEMREMEERYEREMVALREQVQETKTQLLEASQKTIELEEERFHLTKKLELKEAEVEEVRRREVALIASAATAAPPPSSTPPAAVSSTPAQPLTASLAHTSPPLPLRSSLPHSIVGDSRPSLIALQQIEARIARLLNQPPV